jgi:hypothetical protein
VDVKHHRKAIWHHQRKASANGRINFSPDIPLGTGELKIMPLDQAFQIFAGQYNLTDMGLLSNIHAWACTAYLVPIENHKKRREMVWTVVRAFRNGISEDELMEEVSIRLGPLPRLAG